MENGESFKELYWLSNKNCNKNILTRSHLSRLLAQLYNLVTPLPVGKKCQHTFVINIHRTSYCFSFNWRSTAATSCNSKPNSKLRETHHFHLASHFRYKSSLKFAAMQLTGCPRIADSKIGPGQCSRFVSLT